jgi:hypothetical protein
MKTQILFSVCASFEGADPAAWWPCETTITDVERAWPLETGADVESYEGETLKDFESEYDSGLWGDDSEDRADKYSRLASLKCSGILTRDQLLSWLSDLGAGDPDTATMGTLGGPLGYLVADVAFRMEARFVVESIRVTPFLANSEGNPIGGPSEFALELWAEAMAEQTWGHRKAQAWRKRCARYAMELEASR